MWRRELLRGMWNGFRSWALVVLHACGRLARYPVYDAAQPTAWYTVGFLLGARLAFGVRVGAVRWIVKRWAPISARPAHRDDE